MRATWKLGTADSGKIRRTAGADKSSRRLARRMATAAHTPRDDDDADASIGSLFRITFGCIVDIKT